MYKHTGAHSDVGRRADVIELRSPGTEGFRQAQGLGTTSAESNKKSYPTAWLFIDESDNDPPRFMRYLLVALQNASPGESFL